MSGVLANPLPSSPCKANGMHRDLSAGLLRCTGSRIQQKSNSNGPPREVDVHPRRTAGIPQSVSQTMMTGKSQGSSPSCLIRLFDQTCFFILFELGPSTWRLPHQKPWTHGAPIYENLGHNCSQIFQSSNVYIWLTSPHQGP